MGNKNPNITSSYFPMKQGYKKKVDMYEENYRRISLVQGSNTSETIETFNDFFSYFSSHPLVEHF